MSETYQSKREVYLVLQTEKRVGRSLDGGVSELQQPRGSEKKGGEVIWGRLMH